MLTSSMANEQDNGGENPTSDSTGDVEYVFDGFRVMVNEKIMLIPATPALPMTPLARGAK